MTTGPEGNVVLSCGIHPPGNRPADAEYGALRDAGVGNRPMIEVHLYGKLRRFAPNADPTSPSVVPLDHDPGATIARIASRTGIPLAELGTNPFRKGRYATANARVSDGDRIGLFPGDMPLLYKWYFDPAPEGRPT
jgi:hypothetical protein